MTVYLAKSDGETIVEHTLELKKNLEILKSIYPKIVIDWPLLELACLYHDLGKMNNKMQEKLKRNLRSLPGEVPHGLLSTSLLPEDELEEQYSLTELKALAYAIACHHERDFSKIDVDQFESEIEVLREEAQQFPFELLGLEKTEPEELSGMYYELGTHLSKRDGEVYPQYVMLKGLLNRIDYAASAHGKVEYPNDFLEVSMRDLNYEWNPLQNYMLEHQNENVVVIAQTGIGKTEAGLLWLGQDKGFFTLPLRAAINAIYDRISKNIVRSKQDERVGLLHSETFSQYLKLEEEHFEGDILEYENRTKQWTLPLTICTLDQVFDFVYRYAGYEPKLATLSYSKVIIDEIQMYSADLLAYLIYGLDLITQYGGKFAILTATLAPFILDLMQERAIPFEMPNQPFIDEKLPLRHSVEVIHEEISIDRIIPKVKENRVLVICNTVRKAKEIYKQLQNKLGIEQVQLLHSQFTKKDRQAKEAEIFEFGQKEFNGSGVWVATQVVEASLDIDFDYLYTELTDLNGLFQRMGRCYRKRTWKESVGTNVYIFDGGSRKCSGVGYVVDKEIYQLSKNVLAKISGPLDEVKKMALIADTYTTEKVKETNYYKDVENNIKYLDMLFENEKSKAEVKGLFRQINNTSFIPESVYKQNQKIIDEQVTILQKKNNKEATDSERNELYLSKRKARNELGQYKVDLPNYILKPDMFKKPLVLNEYEQIAILDCFYDQGEGVTLKKPEKEEYIF